MLRTKLIISEESIDVKNLKRYSFLTKTRVALQCFKWYFRYRILKLEKKDEFNDMVTLSL